MSIFFLTFKGLNYGVDFKGGTLIELRSDNTNYKTEDIRGAFNKLNLDDLSVKKFGAEVDYIIKFKRSDLNEPDFIKNLKNDLDLPFKPDLFHIIDLVNFDSQLLYKLKKYKK